MADDRVLATVLFTDIVDSTRRAAEIGDSFLAMFDGPQRAIRCAMAIRDARVPGQWRLFAVATT